jgi:hypothetical protein
VFTNAQKESPRDGHTGAFSRGPGVWGTLGGGPRIGVMREVFHRSYAER